MRNILLIGILLFSWCCFGQGKIVTITSTKDTVYVKVPDTCKEVRVYDEMGKKISNDTIVKDLDLSILSEGRYLVLFYNEERITTKLIRN